MDNSTANSQNITPMMAREMLQRMRNDYHNLDFFEELCEDDPTIETRYQTLLSILEKNTDIGENNNTDTDVRYEDSDFPFESQPPINYTPIKTLPAQKPTITSIWDYRSEILKLYILSKLALQTPEFQFEKQETERNIQDFGNRHRVRKRIPAQQLLEQEKKKVLVGFGIRVADAQLLFKSNPSASDQQMSDLRKEIHSEENDHLHRNLWRVYGDTNRIYFTLRKKYMR